MEKLKSYSFYFITSLIIRKYFLFIIVAVTFIVNGFFISIVSAESITKNYLVVSGSDASGDTSSIFSDLEIQKLASVDGNRIQSNGTSWPRIGSYDESKYLEFVFNPDVPVGVNIESVKVVNNFRRSGALTEAKLEVWNGSSFIDQNVSKGQNTATDNNEEIDVTSYINTPELANGLIVRFLAYRDDGANTKTSHDFIGVTVVYNENSSGGGGGGGGGNNNFTEITSNIETDTTWTKENSPYIINSTISVISGATLSIEEGVVVKFGAGAVLEIAGKIEAQGSPSEPIYFTSIKDDSVGGDTNNDGDGSLPEVGDWDYLLITQGDSTSIMDNVVERYSNQGLVLYGGGLVNFNNFNSDNGIISFGSEGSFSNLTTIFIELYDGSIFNIEQSNIINENGVLVSVYNGSSFNIKNSKIEGNNDYLINIFKNSTGNFDNVEINNNKITGTIFAIYDYSSLNTNNGSFSSFNDGFYIFDNSSADFKNINLNCDHDGILTYNNSFLNILNGNISCLNDGISLYSEASANISRVKISDATDAGIIVFNNTIPGTINITKSEITNNNYGFVVFNSDISVHQNNIHDNFTAGAFTFVPTDLDFISNYWGDPSGPIHQTNPNGIGDEVSDNILFKPFLKSDPLIEKIGISNVMLIPGIEASRLYQMRDILGSEYEDKLWEPNTGSDIRDLFMDSGGVSINNSIYTKDIVDVATIFGLGVKRFYRSFMDQMDELVTNNEIADWKAIAYDWRLSPTDIVNRGIEKEDGSISYNENLSNNQIPYIIDQLQKLKDSSNSGKVTIVVHSNGGLVAKALIYKLKEMNKNNESDLINYIDNIIFVGSPLLGTPEAVPALLHGYSQGMLLNLLVSRKNARDFGQNIPGAYNLLPSKKYFNEINNGLILFDESLDKINNWRSLYGNSINNTEEFKSFLTSSDNNRIKPNYDDLKQPLILNEYLLNKSDEFHNYLDDLDFPSTIKVHKVAGWGIATPYDLKYKSKSSCNLLIKLFCVNKGLTLSSDLGLRSSGDGTVLSETALFGAGTNYYLNLNEYNKKYPNKSHANEFDISFLFDLIFNILNDDLSLPEYITQNKPPTVDFTVIKMHSPVAIDLYDESGLHTGLVENENPELSIVEENIPNSLYLEVGDEKYIVFPRGENYHLELTGLSDGIFTLDQESVVNDTFIESVSFEDISTTSLLRGIAEIKANSLITNILLDRDGDGVFELNFTPLTKEENTNIQIGNNHQSGSTPFLNNKINQENIDNIYKNNYVKNTEENLLYRNKMFNLKDNTKYKKQEKNEAYLLKSNINNISASAGSSGIINFRVVIPVVVVLIIILIIFKYKKYEL